MPERNSQQSRRSVGQQVARKVRELILQGRFEPGDKLPPERQLAQMLGVNRASLREGLKSLEHAGLLRSRQGDGTRVLDYRRSAGLEVLGHLLPYQPGPLVLRDLLEFREAMGSQLAALAARRADEAQIAALEALVQDGATDDAKRSVERDFEFYDRLNPGNLVFTLLLNTVRPIIADFGTVLADWIPTPQQTHAHQLAVIAAIKARDSDAAFAAASRHLARGRHNLAARYGLDPDTLAPRSEGD